MSRGTSVRLRPALALIACCGLVGLAARSHAQPAPEVLAWKAAKGDAWTGTWKYSGAVDGWNFEPKNASVEHDRREIEMELVAAQDFAGFGALDVTLVKVTWVYAKSDWEAQLVLQKGQEVRSSWKPKSTDPARKAQIEEAATTWIQESKELLAARYVLSVNEDGATLALNANGMYQSGASIASLFRTGLSSQGYIVPPLSGQAVSTGTTWPVGDRDVPRGVRPDGEKVKPLWKVTACSATGTTFGVTINPALETTQISRNRGDQTFRAKFTQTVVFSDKSFLTSARRTYEQADRSNGKERSDCSAYDSRHTEELSVRRRP